MRSEYLPNILLKNPLPNLSPISKNKALIKNVTMLVIKTLRPATLAPNPTPKLFIVRAKAKEKASLGSITLELSLSARDGLFIKLSLDLFLKN